LRELNGKSEAPFFAKVSSADIFLSTEIKNKLRGAGFDVLLNPDGLIELRKNGHVFRIKMNEPIASIEFFPVRSNDLEFPEDARFIEGYVVILGWTQANYYRYRAQGWQQSNEAAFKIEAHGQKVAGLAPYHIKVEPEHGGEFTISDPSKGKLYLSSKQFKNLMEAIHVQSKEELEKFPFVNRLRAPGVSLLSLYLEGQRLGDKMPASVAEIFTHAATSISQIKNPDFSPFFSPLVQKAFDVAFRGDNFQRFTLHFSDVVKTLSDQALVPVPLGEVKNTSHGEPVMRFRSKNGQEYIVYYRFSSRSPLAIVRLGSK
jgi:hypothetical protein